MEDIKNQVIIKLVADLHERFGSDATELKQFIENSLDNYSLIKTEAQLIGSDLKERIDFFVGVRSLDGLSQGSLDRYREELNLFARYVDKSVADITINDIRQYFATIQRERHLEKTTINNKISPIKVFFNFLYTEEIIQKDPSLKLKRLKVDNKSLRDSLSVEELELLRNACQNIREKVIVEFLYSTGCRLSEAIGTKVSVINWIDNSLVVHGKGEKDRTVFFSVKCKIYLKEYLSKRGGQSDYLFISERRPYRVLTNSGLERALARIAGRTIITSSISPHILRHTFATLALQRGMGLDMIQQLLGHASIGTTQIYAETSQRAVKAAYEQFVAA